MKRRDAQATSKADPGAVPTLQAALSLYERGFNVTPVKRRGKAPCLTRWPERRLRLSEFQEHFRDGLNVGIIMGESSGNLVDVDIDDDGLLGAASAILPPTSAVFGRTSRPRSHYLYRVTEPVPTKKFDGGELRSSGAQTVGPGSVHESGDLYRWDEDGEPATVIAAVLTAAVERLFQSQRQDATEVVSVAPFSVAGVSVASPVSVALQVYVSVARVLNGQASEAELREAVESTLPTEPRTRNANVFKLARVLKHNLSLTPVSLGDLQPLIDVWYSMAHSRGLVSDSLDQTRSDFNRAWRAAKHSTGLDIAALAWDAVRDSDAAREAEPAEKLAILCAELQREVGERPFSLSVRQAGRAILPNWDRQPDQKAADRLLKRLEGEGRLFCVDRGKPGPPGSRASRYRWHG